MPIKTPVYVVCSPRDRVGKTLIARLLIEFLLAERRAVRAFDLDCGHGSLADCLPHCTDLASIGDTRGQMALLDRLVRDDRVAKVVDLGHREFERFFDIAAQVRLIQEADQHGAQVVALFVANSDPASVESYTTLRQRLPELLVVPVHNKAVCARLPQPFSRDGTAATPLRVDALAPGIQPVVADPVFSIAAFRKGIRGAAATRYRFEIESWYKRIFVEFRELQLRLLLASLRLPEFATPAARC